MTVSNAYRIGLTRPALPATHAQPGTEPWLRQQVEMLQRQLVTQSLTDRDRQAVTEIVRLGMRPDVLDALRGRRDPQVAVRDLATRYAFAALMVEGRPIHDLDALSWTLVQYTLDDIHRRAAGMAPQLQANPLQADDGLFLALCKEISYYTLRKPLGAHINTKLRFYESDVRRAMRQIKHLVTRPEIKKPFLAHVAALDVPAELKAQLQHIAEKGRLAGTHYEEIVRFFGRPDTVAFVKRFASAVQTARTLYAEEEYEGICWQGKRRLPSERRQGYLEAALNYYKRLEDVSLDAFRQTSGGEEDPDWYEVLPPAADDDFGRANVNALHKEPFEVSVTRNALEARPDDPLWQAGALLFIRRLSPADVVAQGLATRETVAAVQERMEALRADPEVWHAWMASRLG